MRLHPRVAIATVALALLTAACGTDGTDPDVLPIEGVLAGEIELTPDPSGTFALLRVESTIPLACSVVYGTTDAFGLIATDEDMAGGAHVDHQPRLRGLAPATTYRYRLQGSDAAGNLYRSEIMTFETPAATAPDTPGDNVATRASVVAVSSEFSAAFGAANAIDGDASTEWSTDGDGDDAFLTIDLGSETDVAGIGFRSREMSDGSSVIEEYTVTVDGGEVLGPFQAGTGRNVTEVAFTGRQLRFDATLTTGGNTGAVEIEVYAAR